MTFFLIGRACFTGMTVTWYNYNQELQNDGYCQKILARTFLHKPDSVFILVDKHSVFILIYTVAVKFIRLHFYYCKMLYFVFFTNLRHVYMQSRIEAAAPLHERTLFRRTLFTQSGAFADCSIQESSFPFDFLAGHLRDCWCN